MYQALLIFKYLTSKVMPLLAAAAVMLCTAMVLIVWSVMGGFLVMLLGSGRTLMGDVSITWPVIGFGHYGELIDRLEADPMVAAATPIVETIGSLSLPDGRISMVLVNGIDGPGYARVTGYEDSLWWKPLAAPLPKDKDRRDWRLEDPDGDAGFWKRAYQDGLALSKQDEATGVSRPAAVLGIELSSFNRRDPGGWYQPLHWDVRAEDGSIRLETGPTFILKRTVTLNVIPLTRQGRSVNSVARVLPVANEFKSGVFDIDAKKMFIPLATLQEMLKMDQAGRVAPPIDPYELEIGEDGEETFIEAEPTAIAPARVTSVLVRAKDGVSPEALKDQVRAVYVAFERDHKGQVPHADRGGIHIQTWREAQGVMVAAVEKETLLVLFILWFISLVASVLILAIFWAMISEKTKDIGILRSMGASKGGIAGLWLIYGLVIGLIGSALGLGVAHAIVWNINPIHEWMGRALNVQIWNPEIYYFTLIPSRVRPDHAAIVFAAGVGFSVLGALIPAVRAANMDPVRSLRFE
ncbi:MAG: ABC transporter permease [Phycisphaerales bacterium]|nr:ABC transporter permease [Phycisphaerales bacterium]